MTITLDQLTSWLTATENEHLEFKEAKESYDFDKLVKYCAAIANEGGGYIILGVSDKQPRIVVGSQAFTNLERIKGDLLKKLHFRVDAEIVNHPDGRLVVFSVPSRPLGQPVHVNGTYLMRSGEELVPMTPDRLKLIFDESGPDFSAEVCVGAKLTDLDSQAIQLFREMWQRKSGNSALSTMSEEQLLIDAELIQSGNILYAALVLFGKEAALGRFLPQAEIVFEYRSGPSSGPATQRQNYRQGFFLFQNDLWQKIDLRNDRQHFQSGFFVIDVPTFNEIVVREAILNAVSHRDYRLPGSVFVRQYSRQLEVVSPGGFPPGINTENILWRQIPRNRRIAEAFDRCGLVERAGQGMNRIFEECIKESKAIPDFTGTDDYQVSITLEGEVQDPRFLRFLEQIGRERLASFDTRDFLVLDCIHQEKQVSIEYRSRLPRLIEQGIIEQVGRGRGTRYTLSRRFYNFLGQKGEYTRKKGLDRETNKMLLLKHIEDSGDDGCQLQELAQVLPGLSTGAVQALVRELKAAGQIHNIGRTKAARWYLGPGLG